MEIFVGVLFGLYWCIALALIIYLITLASRFVRAVEKIANKFNVR